MDGIWHDDISDFNGGIS